MGVGLRVTENLMRRYRHGFQGGDGREVKVPGRGWIGVQSTSGPGMVYYSLGGRIGGVQKSSRRCGPVYCRHVQRIFLYALGLLKLS